MGRWSTVRLIEGLDPETDDWRIYRLHAQQEFPWDVTRALELALFRTYAVPSIGGLLDSTGELRTRTQRRYDDTALLLAEVLENGLDSGTSAGAATSTTASSAAGWRSRTGRRPSRGVRLLRRLRGAARRGTRPGTPSSSSGRAESPADRGGYQRSWTCSRIRSS